MPQVLRTIAVMLSNFIFLIIFFSNVVTSDFLPAFCIKLYTKIGFRIPFSYSSLVNKMGFLHFIICVDCKILVFYLELN